MNFYVGCNHSCKTVIEARLEYHLNNQTFDGDDVRFPRHIQSKTTKRWMYCPVSSNLAKIPPTDGLKLGEPT